MFDNTFNPSLSDDHSGEGQRKHGHKTNYEDKEERKEKPAVFVVAFLKQEDLRYQTAKLIRHFQNL